MILKDAVNHFFYTMTVNELQLMSEKFQSLNITYNSLLYLDLIAYTPNCTVTFLSQTLRISKPAVTMKVNELVRQGIVEKRQSEEDKRIHYLVLNEELRKIYDCYDRAMYQAISRANEQYSPEEQEIFCKILTTLEKEYMEEIRNEE